MNPARRISPAWLAATLAAFVADLFLHLPITDYCEMLAKQYGFIEYDNTTRIVFAIFGGVLLAAAWAWPSGRRLAIGTSTTILLAVVVALQALIIVTAVENIHYPQYALVAYLLMRACRDPDLAWLGATVLGALDEVYQLVALPRGTPGYFDWNDVVLNGVGAAFGVVVALALSRDERFSLRWSGRIFTLAIGAAIAIGFLIGPPVFSPFFTFTPGGRSFRILSAFEAAIALAAVWLLVRLTAVAQPSGGVVLRSAQHR